MANQELAKKVLDHILAHPEEHDQSTWGIKAECGTVACIAGWTCILAGQEEWQRFVDEDAWGLPNFSTPRLAGQLLGISEDDRPELFFCFDNDEALRRLKHFADTGELPSFTYHYDTEED